MPTHHHNGHFYHDHGRLFWTGRFYPRGTVEYTRDGRLMRIANATYVNER